MERAYYVGEELTEGFSTSRPGETFTVLESRDPAGAAWFTLEMISEIGDDGAYLITFTPQLVGNYFANWAGASSTVVLDGNWFVQSARAAPSTGAVGTTKRELRRRIGGASGLGDFTLLVATAAGDGIFTDVNRLFLPLNAYEGRELYMASGVNLGANRRVAGNSPNNRSLTLDPTFPTAVAVGDEGELWNTSGTGWHVWEVDDVINDIITEARHGWWIPQSLALPDLLDPLSPIVTIPNVLTHVFAVGWQDDGGLWNDIGPADYPGGNGWFVDAATGTIRIGGNAVGPAGNHALQVRGYGQLAELVSDDDVTPLNVEWHVKEAVARLLLMALGRRPENQVKYPAARQIADRARPFAMLRAAPDMVRVA